MDALSKTAIMEISKLVEIESKMLKIEITRGRNEIASLTEKLQLMEKLLYIGSNRQETAAAMVRSASESGRGLVESNRTRPAINSLQPPRESPRDSISSSTEASLQQGHEQTAATELPNTLKEQPEVIVIKEEPYEDDCKNFEQNRTSENKREVITDTLGSSDIVQSSRHIHKEQQPIFTDSFIILSNQSSFDGSERRKTQWNLQLLAACTNLETGKSWALNTVSSAMARSAKIHSLRNSSAKRFGCLQCGKSFRCFSQLEIHQRSHTGEKPFRCTLCGKTYAQKGHLYTHQRTHTGEKPYRCPICAKGFIQKCTLDMHQRTHTGEKPFVCIKCGKGFTKNCNLKKHLAVHIDASLHIFGSESSASSTFNGTFINGTT